MINDVNINKCDLVLMMEVMNDDDGGRNLMASTPSFVLLL